MSIMNKLRDKMKHPEQAQRNKPDFVPIMQTQLLLIEEALSLGTQVKCLQGCRYKELL